MVTFQVTVKFCTGNEVETIEGAMTLEQVDNIRKYLNDKNVQFIDFGDSMYTYVNKSNLLMFVADPIK